MVRGLEKHTDEDSDWHFFNPTMLTFNCSGVNTDHSYFLRLLQINKKTKSFKNNLLQIRITYVFLFQEVIKN